MDRLLWRPSAPDSSQTSSNRAGDPGARWYVVQTIVRQEPRADAQLRAQSFEVFLPRVERTIRHARKLRTVLSAAFPGYLFVRLDLRRDRWRSINGTIGVSRLIMGEDLPIPAPAGVVETIFDYVDHAGVARFDRDLVAGQAVRVKAGPLANSLGELVRLDANGRVRVLLEIMGGKVETKVARADLEAA
jgi:transcription antitermination factor NusG